MVEKGTAGSNVLLEYVIATLPAPRIRVNAAKGNALWDNGPLFLRPSLSLCALATTVRNSGSRGHMPA